MNKLMELVKDYAGRDLCVFLAAPPESISSKEERTKAVKKEYLKWEKKKAKIQAIADQWERMQWVSLEDRYPEKNKECLVAITVGRLRVPNYMFYWDGSYWVTKEDEYKYPKEFPVIKWMYKPNPPLTIQEIVNE